MTYHGVIIEESLEDKSVLDSLIILKTIVEPVTPNHKTPWLQQWTLHTVTIDDNKAESIAETISHALDREHAWYADYKNSSFHFVIFRDKYYKIDRACASYDEAVSFGLALGIPDYQLDFSPAIEEWKREQS